MWLLSSWANADDQSRLLDHETEVSCNDDQLLANSYLLALSGTSWAPDKLVILVIRVDDIGWSNLNACNHAAIGYGTTNIVRIAQKARKLKSG